MNDITSRDTLHQTTRYGVTKRNVKSFAARCAERYQNYHEETILYGEDEECFTHTEWANKYKVYCHIHGLQTEALETEVTNLLIISTDESIKNMGNGRVHRIPAAAIASFKINGMSYKVIGKDYRDAYNKVNRFFRVVTSPRKERKYTWVIEPYGSSSFLAKQIEKGK